MTELDDKGWDEVARMPVRRVPPNIMTLHRDVGEGEMNERTFIISIGLDGSIWLTFDRRPDDPPEGPKDRFRIGVQDMLEAIAESGAVV